MAAPRRGPDDVTTMRRSHLQLAVPRTAAPPLIGVVTHELVAESGPAWAAAPGRSERDLAPARLSMRLSYTQAPEVDRASDEYELALLRAAAERDLPVLGICRGLQAINVSRGGTLHQHLPDFSDAACGLAPQLSLAA